MTKRHIYFSQVADSTWTFKHLSGKYYIKGLQLISPISVAVGQAMGSVAIIENPDNETLAGLPTSGIVLACSSYSNFTGHPEWVANPVIAVHQNTGAALDMHVILDLEFSKTYTR